MLLPQPGVPVQRRTPHLLLGEEVTRAAGPAAEKGEMQKHAGPLVPAGSSGGSGCSLCPRKGTRAPKPVWVGQPVSDWPEHVSSPEECWQHDASSSSCLKTVKINLFLKSSAKRLPQPPALAAAWLPGRPGLQNHPCGSSGFKLKHEDAAKTSAARLAALPALPSSLLLAVGVWCRRKLLMVALCLPKCCALAPSWVCEGAGVLLSPRFIASPRGRGCPLGAAPPDPPVFERGPAMPSGRTVGRRGGS